MAEATPLPRAENISPPGAERPPIAVNTPNRIAREDLLVWKDKAKLLEAIKKYDTVLLIAGTGTGKTRGGAQIALEAIGPTGKMVMTENLRRATQDGATTILGDRQVDFPEEKMGEVVGYQNKYAHDKADKDTRLLFCPIQTLLNKVERDKQKNTNVDAVPLSDYDLIMVDEVHKESKQNEILLATLKDLQAKRAKMGRPLKVILTSATMDEEKLMSYFPNVGKVEVPGTNFPIDDKIWHDRKVPIEELPVEAAKKVQFSIKRGDKGNILVFLSGQAQINKAQAELDAMLKRGDIDPEKTVVAQFLGSMSKEEQDKTLAKFGDKQVIVLATNAAQESLTWPVKVVVDTCTHKHQMFDPVTGRSYLTEEFAPLDHLMQRKGRVGRKDPGADPDKYYALTTEDDWKGRPKHESPEIERTDLTSEVLTLIASGYDPYNFPFINKPYNSHIDSAYKRLERIGALKGKTLTEKGIFMSRLQLNVNNASLVADGLKYNALKDSAALAAMLEEYPQAFEGDNALLTEMKKGKKSDLTPLVDLFNSYESAADKAQWVQERGLRLDTMVDVYDLYTEIMKEAGKSESPALTLENVSRYQPYGLDLAIHDSFADTKITGFKKHYITIDGVGGEAPLRVDKRSVLGQSRFYSDPFVSADIRATTGTIYRDVIENRLAGLNHTLTPEVLGLIYGLEHSAPDESKPISESDSQRSTVESPDTKPEVVDVNAEVPLPIEDVKKPEEAEEEKKPLPFYKRWWQGFTGWLSRIFGS